jgi:hypothetical protein
MLLSMIRSDYLSTRSSKRLSRELVHSLPGKEPGTRSRMVGLVRVLNDRSVVEALEAARNAEQDESVREHMRHAIRCLEAGHSTLPM